MSNYSWKELLKSAFLGLFFMVILTASDRPDQFTIYEEVFAGTDLQLKMIPVRGGSFTMGSTEDEIGRDPDEGPAHEVQVDDFWISEVEITWDMYEVFLYRNKDKIPHPDPGDLQVDVDGVSGATMPYVNFNKPGYPVVNVTQYAASVFCEWLTARTGRFYRLPTEAEWEYACRAGTRSAYSFGDAGLIDDFAWHKGNSNGTVNRGKMKYPNPLGLYDMHGNASEWVLDFYDENAYSGLTSENPYLQKDELYPHVVRGGSWQDPPEELRSASREYSAPAWKKRDPQFPKSLWWHTDALHVGFRIVRPRETPEGPERERFRIKPINDY